MSVTRKDVLHFITGRADDETIREIGKSLRENDATSAMIHEILNDSAHAIKTLGDPLIVEGKRPLIDERTRKFMEEIKQLDNQEGDLTSDES